MLLRDAMHVLMGSTPRGLSLQAVCDRNLVVPGVVGVHDLPPGRSPPASP
jgi:Co/Zn/Cd efflux system component